MKKIFGILAVAAMAMAFNTSCSEKEDNGGNGGNGNGVNVRIASWADDWDKYVYTFDDAGKVVKADRNDGERVWNFAYNGNVVEVTGYSAFTITIGANGYASEYKDEWDTFTYTYNNEGYVTQIKKNGEVCSNVTVVDGCITKWSKFEDRDEDGVAEELWKNHTYSSVKNVAGIHNIYAEKGAGRWLQELGFFGKPTKYLCESNGWDYSANPSALTYEFDDKGCVTKESKTASDYTENYFYTWTAL